LARETGEASALLGIVANTRGQWKAMFLAEFVDVVRRSREIAASVFDAHLCIAEFSLYGSSRSEEIREYARQLLEVAEGAGSVQGRALGELFFGEADLISGHLESAEGHLSASAHLHEQAGVVAGRVIAIQRLAESAVAKGQRGRAGRLLRSGLRLAESSHMAPHLMVRMHEGLVAAAQGAAVLTAVREGEAALIGQVVCPPCSIGFRVAVAQALANNGDLDMAQKRLDEAEQIAGMWSAGPWHAAVWEARGVLRRAQGNEDEAAAMLQEAAGRFADAGRPRDEARCRTYSEASGLAL
jgi:ATP/maltotriose-dependent transcriptional regulator MalT